MTNSADNTETVPLWSQSSEQFRAHLLSAAACEDDLYLWSEPRVDIHVQIVQHLFYYAAPLLLYSLLWVFIACSGLHWTLPISLPPVGALLVDRAGAAVTILVTVLLYYRYARRYLGYIGHVAPASADDWHHLVDYAIAVVGISLIIVAPLPQPWLFLLVALVFLAGLRYWCARRRLLRAPSDIIDLRAALNCMVILPEKYAFGMLWTVYSSLLVAISVAVESRWATAVLVLTVIPAQVWYSAYGRPLTCARRFLATGNVLLLSTPAQSVLYPRWLDAIARAVSIVMSPFVMTLALIIPTSYKARDGSSLCAFVIMAIGGIVAPFLLAVFRKQQRDISDIHIVRRLDRPPFFNGVIVSGVLSWLGLAVMDVGRAPTLIYGGFVLSIAIINAQTARMKVSAHCCASAGVFAFLCIAHPQWAAFSGIWLLCTAWARVWRGRHTIKECCIGAIVGAASIGVCTWLSLTSFQL